MNVVFGIILLSACGGGSSSSGVVIGPTSSEPSQFASGFGDELNQDIRAVTSDSGNNIIIVGHAEGDVDFGGGTVNSADDNIFVAKFDSSGTHLWSRVISGSGNDAAGDVAVDSNDNILVSGAFGTQINFGASGDELNTVGAQDMFVAKLDGNNGAHIWSFSAGGAAASATFPAAIAISPFDDSVVVAGTFSGSGINLGGGALPIVGGSQVFLARFLNSNAIHQFSASYGNANDQDVAGVAVDSLGNIVLAGSFFGSIDLGGDALTTNGGTFNDAYLARFDSVGVHLTSAAYGGTGSDVATGVAIDSNDIIVLSGLFFNSTDFGGGALSTQVINTANFYIARFNSTQTHLFSQRYGGLTGTGPQGRLKVAIDLTNDDMILAGNYTGSVSFGGDLFSTAGTDLDIVLARLASNGTHISSTSYGDDSDQLLRDVAVSGTPRYLLAGYFDGEIDLGVSSISGISSMDNDAYLISLAP